jgi:hypothetical protein
VAAGSIVEQVLASGLVQPDQRTCGSCVLVVARVVSDPSYAGFLVDGAARAAANPASATIRDRFDREALAVRRVTAGCKDSDGRWQLPWPRALGTSPWALAREMATGAVQGNGPHAARLILPGRRSRTFERIVSLAGAGHAVPLYVGNRWWPRHVVLVLPATQQPRNQIVIYDPATGHRYAIEGRDFSHGRLDVAGWRVPWLVVVPT